MTPTLTTRISLGASLIGLLLISGLGVVSYRVTQELVHGQLFDALEYTSQRVADGVTHRINTLLDHQRNLAGNTLMANALVDDLGRERYLPGFLEDMQKVGGLAVSIHVTNFLGQVIAHNGDATLRGISQEQIAGIVEQGRFQVAMDPRDPNDPQLILIRPIIFANTGLPEGALIYEIRAKPLMPDEKTKGGQGELDLVGGVKLVIRVGDERELSLATGERHDGDAPTTRIELALQDDGVMHVELVVSGNPAVFREANRKLLANYLWIAVMTLLLILVLSRQLARYLTSGLRLLQSGAEEIVAKQSFSQRLVVGGNDEVARVGRAFNSVLNRLEKAYRELEVRSYEALRQKDEKYRAVVQQAGEGLLLFDRDFLILEANHSTYELLQATSEVLIGHPVTGLVPESMARMLTQGRLTEETFETDMQRADGSRVPVEITAGVVMVEGERHFLWLFRDITERRAANAALLDKQQQLEALAYHDALTQLPNRYLFSDRVRQAMAHSQRKGTLLALCYLDLDGFKAVNDTLGHELGDRLLISVSQRLTNLLRREDTVARLGGDEFVLLLGDIESPEQLKEALQRILENLARPYVIAEKQCTVSASIGVTVYPDDNHDADTLVRHADQAMYQAKELGRNRYHLFDPRHANETVDKG